MTGARDLRRRGVVIPGWMSSTIGEQGRWQWSGCPAYTEVREALSSGAGVAWIQRAFDPGKPALARETVSALCSDLGQPLSQTATGDRWLDVRDHGFGERDPRFRGPHSSRGLSFHTDRCDVIVFACVRAAQRGGETLVLSSERLAHDLRERHPHLWPVLSGVFPYRRHAIDPDNPDRCVDVPLFTSTHGRFAASYLRVLIDRAHADPTLPDLSPAQLQALDALDAAASESDRAVRFTMQPGDLLLLNNWVTFHRRTAFEDAPGSEGRLLWRIWLSTPWSREIDERFRAHFGATAAGVLRGGIWPRGARDG